GLEILQEGRDRDRVAGALVVACAASSLRNLVEVALATEATASAAEACVSVVDGIDGYAGTLSVGHGSADVGAVLVGDAGAAVVGIDAVGDHEDETSLMGGLGGRGLTFGVGGPVLHEVRETEVGAGAGASQSHGQTQGLADGGTIRREARGVAG